jgi:anti-sigma regulatory factor (Ser/Thr protein kinase)
MVSKGLRSDGDSSPRAPRDMPEMPDGPDHGSVPAPWPFAARVSPRDLAGYRIEVIALPSGGSGVLVGCADPAGRLFARARETLLETADPQRTLDGVTGTPSSVACAVIDGDTMSFGTRGPAGIAVSAPGCGPALHSGQDGMLGVTPLLPGATVLMCTGPIDGAAGLLADCADMHPGQLADQIIAELSGAAMIYRHPPQPLVLTLPAEPASLSVGRGRLRDWLTAAGVDAEARADVLLAVGEATANATEHSVVCAAEPVEMTVIARCDGPGLRLTVSDNGSWKPASVTSGHRGHGVHLMKALVNSVELTMGSNGTTVTMVKELTR